MSNLKDFTGMAVKDVAITLSTARDQASYYFDRDVNCVDWNMFNAIPEAVEVQIPSYKVLFSRFVEESSDIDYLVDLFNEEVDTEVDRDNLLGDEDFVKWASDSDMYSEWSYTTLLENHYPMWGTVFIVSDDFIERAGGVDGLYDCGIGLVSVYHNEKGLDDKAMFISGAGYDFYDHHWIPLFVKMGYIKELKENK